MHTRALAHVYGQETGLYKPEVLVGVKIQSSFTRNLPKSGHNPITAKETAQRSIATAVQETNNGSTYELVCSTHCELGSNHIIAMNTISDNDTIIPVQDTNVGSFSELVLGVAPRLVTVARS